MANFFGFLILVHFSFALLFSVEATGATFKERFFYVLKNITPFGYFYYILGVVLISM